MVERFSEATKFWIEKRNVLFAAEERFSREFSDILQKVEDNLQRKGWKTRLTGDPFDQIQVCRPHWPSTLSGVHYEARVFKEFLRKGIVDLNLHIENDVPNQEAICARMRNLLRPHAREILSICRMKILEEPVEAILKGSLPLVEVTVDELTNTIEKMAETESFVDEALYLADKRTVYRTEIHPGTRPRIIFKDNAGGWEFSPRGGRLDGPCLKCQGEKFNWNGGDNTNILMLHPDGGFFEFENNKYMYFSTVVSSPRGGDLWLGTQAYINGKWITIFGEGFELHESEHWQQVTLEGHLKAPKHYDFSRDGLFAYVMVKAPQKEVRFSSIEIGLCLRKRTKP